MIESVFPRRELLKTFGFAAGAAALGSGLAGAAEGGAPAKFHLASNSYPWTTFWRREKRDYNTELDAVVKGVAESGLDGFEPILNSVDDLEQMIPLLKKNKLEMRSFYINSALHDQKEAEKSIANIIRVAQRAKEFGAKIVVSNPSPIRWGGDQDKNDEQLKAQAAALNQLGRETAALGLTLAYHYHAPELRNAAREFHHMLIATDPRLVSLCFDAHWTFRGSGDSAVAVFDAVELYGERIAEVHLRQSVKGTWTETFGAGDIDYAALMKLLLKKTTGRRPHLVLEQAVETGTPQTMTATAAHRQGVQYAHKTLGDIMK